MCRLELDSSGGLVAKLIREDGATLANTRVQVLERATLRDALRIRPVSNADGQVQFRLPERLQAAFMTDLLIMTTVAGQQLCGEVHLEESRIQNGGALEAVRMVPLPQLLAGTVLDIRDEPRTGVALALELGVVGENPKQPDVTTWRVVNRTVTQLGGAFSFQGLVPLGAMLRVRPTAANLRGTTAAETGRSDLRLTVRDRSKSKRTRLRQVLEELSLRDR